MISLWWKIRMGSGNGLLYLNKSRDCLQWHRFTHEPVVETVLYSFLESRCHLSELEYRRMRGGLLSRSVAAPATPAERTALIYSRTNPAVILSTSTMLQRLRDSAVRSVIAGKGMTPAQLFFGLHGHSTEKNRALSEVALFIPLPGLCLSKCGLVRQVLGQFIKMLILRLIYIYLWDA